MNALTAAQGELECAYDSIMDITDDAHVQLNHVVESGQDVTALEQEVTKYGCKQGEHSPLHDDASVSGDSHAVASRRRAQTAREKAESAERHRPFLVERQELARQRKEFQRQKLELERDVELFRAEQAAAKAAHEKRLAELEEASERSAGGQHAVDDETLPRQRLRAIQSPASVAGAENKDNDCQNRESGVESDLALERINGITAFPGSAVDGTSAAITELSGRRSDVETSDRSSPQKRLASRMTDVTTWLKETALPKAGRQPQPPGELHVQGARAAHGAPVRNVARRLAADDPDRKSGSQHCAANSLIYSFAGAVNLDHP